MAVSKYAPAVNKKYSNVITKVLRIIYYNQASKWGVLSCKNTIKDNLFMEPTITVVGNFVGVYENCKVELNGNYKVNSNYGGQLELTSIKVLKDLASAESIINFLVKSGIQGISTQNAVKIYEKFGAKYSNINFGIMFVGFAVSGFFAPIVIGKIYSTFNSFIPAYYVAMVLSALGIILAGLYKRVEKR